MILVNHKGSSANPFPGLRHAAWNGLTPADLVFPTFLVVAGASMAFSIGRARAAGAGTRAGGASRAGAVRGLVRRAVLLVVIGVAINALPHVDWEELRYMGVLQRIGLASLLAGLALLFLPRRRQVGASAVVLVGYAALLRWVPVPGVGHAVLRPDANLPGKVDAFLLGQRHVYGNGGYDPEGLASTLPAAVSVLFGAWAGDLVRVGPRSAATVRRLAAWGALAVVAGVVVHPFVPVNKRLWTSAFVLVSGGLAVLLLAGMFWALDVRRGAWAARLARPFLPLGRNAIVVFVLGEELGYLLQRWRLWFTEDTPVRAWAWHRVFVRIGPDQIGSVLYGCAVLLVVWVVAEVMHRRRWYVRL